MFALKEQLSEFRRVFETKDEAERFANDRATRATLGQIKVHNRDGNMKYESTYGEDPRGTPR